MKILVKNVTLVSAANRRQLVDIAIKNKKTFKVGDVTDFSADKIIEAKGLLAVPGFVDLSARLREPGNSNHGTIASETQAAAAGGFSTVCIPPDTEPVIDNPAVVELIQQRQEQANQTEILPLAAMTQDLKGKRLGAVGTLCEEGCVGVSNALAEFASARVLFRALQYAKSFGLTAHLHPVNYALVGEGSAHQGMAADDLGLPGISQAAETTALAEILMLSEETGAKVHICRISCARSVELIAQAKARDIKVTADVAAHQLFYTEDNLYEFDPNFHVMPPFRTKEDRQALRQGVIDGTIDAICSDHQPQDADSKLAPFSASAVGISSLESFTADILKFCAEEKIKLAKLLPALNKNPARILGIEENVIAPGKKASFCLVDPDRQWQFVADNMHSKGKNSPRLGQTLRGQVMHNIVAGKHIFARDNP